MQIFLVSAERPFNVEAPFAVLLKLNAALGEVNRELQSIIPRNSK
jgi:hypothetical protein